MTLGQYVNSVEEYMLLTLKHVRVAYLKLNCGFIMQINVLLLGKFRVIRIKALFTLICGIC